MNNQMIDISATRTAPWAYGWWALVGALFGIGIAGLLTVGVWFLAAGAVLLVVALAAPALRNRSALGILGGLALAPLYLAWLNRQGPGRVCTVDGTETSCVEQWSPWPFVGVALALVVVCVVLVRRRPRA